MDTKEVLLKLRKEFKEESDDSFGERRYNEGKEDAFYEAVKSIDIWLNHMQEEEERLIAPQPDEPTESKPKDVVDINGIRIETTSELTPIEALAELIKRRDELRNGWRPNWRNDENCYTIIYYQSKAFMTSWATNYARLFAFKDGNQSRQFYEDNKELFELIKQLY